MLGSNGTQRPYLQPGQIGPAPAQAAPTRANTGEGFFGFFSRMFSMAPAARASSGYLQPMPATSPASGEVVFCQPVEGVACQPMAEAIACQPVEGIDCQPVTMVPLSMMQPLSGT